MCIKNWLSNIGYQIWEQACWRSFISKQIELLQEYDLSFLRVIEEEMFPDKI